MHSKYASVPRLDNEKQLLRFLCASGEDIVRRRKLLQQLRQYSWRNKEHQVLFEAIGELLTTAPQQIVGHLPAAVTRLGFPDVSCDALADPPRINAAAAFALAEELLRASQ
ncbi:MAG TPA: hypothetical protein VGS59_11025 [Candidatus Acidoferrales bacterium]|nr:hypothetical protein [Candidatus Acidoferrales bacterium]